MKGLLRLGVFAATLVALPASAGAVYKCVAGDGATAYASKRLAGSACTVVSQYTAQPARQVARPVMAPVAASAPAVALAETAPSPAIAPAPVAAPRPVAGAAPRVVSGQVYSFVRDGVRHYTSARPRGPDVAGVRIIPYRYIQTCYACGNRNLDFGAVRLNPAAYQAQIASAAREFGVEEAIVRAIIHAESSFNPVALSRAGAMGLMQLMPATARRFGVSDAYDAAQNIRGGVQYLAFLLKRYRGDLALAAAGYNAGEGAVDRNGGVPPYTETQRYVQRVGVLAQRYRAQVAAVDAR